MKRGFRSSAVTPVGITMVVCAVITRELLAHDQKIFVFVPSEMLFCDGRAVVLLFICQNY